MESCLKGVGQLSLVHARLAIQATKIVFSRDK